MNISVHGIGVRWYAFCLQAKYEAKILDVQRHARRAEIIAVRLFDTVNKSKLNRARIFTATHVCFSFL
jgi:hypothetical protein